MSAGFSGINPELNPQIKSGAAICCYGDWTSWFALVELLNTKLRLFRPQPCIGDTMPINVCSSLKVCVLWTPFERVRLPSVHLQPLPVSPQPLPPRPPFRLPERYCPLKVSWRCLPRCSVFSLQRSSWLVHPRAFLPFHASSLAVLVLSPTMFPHLGLLTALLLVHRLSIHPEAAHLFTWQTLAIVCIMCVLCCACCLLPALRVRVCVCLSSFQFTGNCVCVTSFPSLLRESPQPHFLCCFQPVFLCFLLFPFIFFNSVPKSLRMIFFSVYLCTCWNTSEYVLLRCACASFAAKRCITDVL